MKNSKEVLKRLTEIEKRLAVSVKDLEQNKKSEDLIVLLEMYEYCRKEQEMTLTREEIRIAKEESSKQIVDWYCEWLKLSPEEQQKMDQKSNYDSIERDKAWLNSEERKQFDTQYEEFLKLRNQNPTEETP
jgi:hypothetical protein